VYRSTLKSEKSSNAPVRCSIFRDDEESNPLRKKPTMVGLSDSVIRSIIAREAEESSPTQSIPTSRSGASDVQRDRRGPDGHHHRADTDRHLIQKIHRHDT